MNYPVKFEVGYYPTAMGFECNAPYQGLIRLTERNHDVELISQNPETGVIIVLVKNESGYKDFKYNTEKVFATVPKYINEL